MGKFSDYFQRKSGGERDGDFGGQNYEYYEDTHNENGEYTARLRNFQRDNSAAQQALSDRAARRVFGRTFAFFGVFARARPRSADAAAD